MKTTPEAAVRLDSIDIFRAVTMLTMIFVNDFWTLLDVPGWMEHSAAADDAMGLSDVVFPAFLFIVGLSIPYAISGRIAKGEDQVAILTHIFERTFALLIMGIFTVNLETALGDVMIIPKQLWSILMVAGFFLVWNLYPKQPERQLRFTKLKVSGTILLIFLALIYRGGDPLAPSVMATQWWGILGLIGWAYLLCAPAYLFVGDRLARIAGVWLVFVLFNLLWFAGALSFLEGVRPFVWIVGDGSMPAFVMAGVTASVIGRTRFKTLGADKFLVVLGICGLICLMYGFSTRPFWGISKIRATPAWVGICSGISFLLFAFFFWLTDIKGKKDWAKIIRPAGAVTLTCYMIPYVVYALREMSGIVLPLVLRHGVFGLLKSLLFSVLVIVLAGKLADKGIRLKI